MTTEIQKTPEKPKALTIRDRLESNEFKAAVAKALPKHLTPDRFIRIACTAIMKTPKLAQCDQASFFNALLTLSQLGIEPDGRRAHLIPFENRKRNVTEVQLIIDYKGLVELVMRSGLVSNLHADVVCENDEFAYDMGTIERHRINFKQPRGAVYAVYCIARFKDGTSKTEVMTVEEVESIRKRSRAAQAGPWVTDWSEMAKKTCFRRLSKWLPLSPEFRDAIEADDNEPAIDISAPQFVIDMPKTKPNLAPKTEVPKLTPPAVESESESKQPEPEPTPPDADAGDGDLAPEHPANRVLKYQITPELLKELNRLSVTTENFEKWVAASGRHDAFEADGVAASAKLLTEERSLKKLQTLYGAEINLLPVPVLAESSDS